MNETTRTGFYVAAAAVVGALAYFTSPSPPSAEKGGRLPPGTTLFSQIDPERIASLEIVRYDNESATKQSFKVEKKNNQWTIPSHGGYSADARSQLEKIAKALASIEVFEIRSEEQADHGTYGVIDPTGLTEDQVVTGQVGTLVAAYDDSNSPLAKIVIGAKSDEGNAAGEDSPRGNSESVKQYFVRNLIDRERAVYVGEIERDTFSPKFGDWIERDLLQLNPLDIVGLSLQDYIADLQQVGNRVGVMFRQQSESNLVVDAGGKWTVADLAIFPDGRKRSPQPLSEEEELNVEKLNQLKTALDDLKIVDVEKKPANLSELLAQGTSTPDGQSPEFDQEGAQTLFEKGFLPLRDGLRGSNGEVVVSQKDGVVYQLRFGRPQGLAEGDAAKLNRWLLVSAEFNADRVPKPELTPVPDGPAGPEKDASEDDAEKADAEKADAEKAEGDDAEKKADGETEADKLKKAQRDRIVKENKRKEEEYEEKIRKGQARARELNERFRDWFYVISEDVYRKIHLDRQKIVKINPEAKKQGFSVEAYRSLLDQGIQGAPKSLATPGAPGGFGIPPSEDP